MKKLISVVALMLSVVMMSSSLAFADSKVDVSDMENPFTDVNASTEQGKAIINMATLGYVAGYSDGTFNPNGEITRAELVRIINQVVKFSAEDEFYTNNAANSADFLDNTEKEAWYYSDVKLAQVYGYINGFEDKTFRPKENFTRQQVCVVLSILAGLSEKDINSSVIITDDVSQWAEKYVKMAVSKGIFTLESGNTFRATQNITRGEVCLALTPFIGEEQVVKTEVVTDAQGEAVTNAEGSTMVATVKSVVSSSGGSSIKVSTTTATTVEATTETTTKASASLTTEATTETTTSSQTTTKSTSSDNTKTTVSTSTEATTETTTKTSASVTTEATTESTTQAVTIEAGVLKSLNRVVKNMNKYVLPGCSTDAQKAVVNAIVDSITSYINDPTYDFTADANEAMNMYKALGSEEKTELKNLITSKNALEDLLTLQEKFFPGLI